MAEVKVLLSMVLLATCLLLAGCAKRAQLMQLAEEEGTTYEEAAEKQLRKAGELEEAVPGVVSGFIFPRDGGGGGH